MFLDRERDTAGHRVEEMEDGTAEEADDCSHQEDHDRPPRDLMNSWSVLMKFYHLEAVGVD
jgi:hypothetical protein